MEGQQGEGGRKTKKRLEEEKEEKEGVWRCRRLREAEKKKKKNPYMTEWDGSKEREKNFYRRKRRRGGREWRCSVYTGHTGIHREDFNLVAGGAAGLDFCISR